MSPTRLLILVVGFVAAILAAVLAVNLTSTTPQTVREIVKVPTIETSKILVASQELKRGDTVQAGSLRWVEWPKNSLTDQHVTQNAKPKAIEDFEGSTVRLTMTKGEPFQVSKVIQNGNGLMAAILEKGKRAVSTNVSPGTAAGGFILPDDRVDVMMTRAVDGPDGNQTFNSVPVLRNVRVLAIDQQIEEQDGQAVVVGKTATLELDDKQVRILTVTQQLADRITLALRSLQDANEPATSDGAFLVGDSDKQDYISIVKYGKRSAVKANK